MAKKRKSKKKCYVLTLPLKVEKYQMDILNKRFELSRKLYNACMGEALKRYTVMSERKSYRSLRKELAKVNKRFHSSLSKKEKKNVDKQRKRLYGELEEIAHLLN